MTRTRRFYLDVHDPSLDGIERGDLLLGPRNAYLVIDAHPTESRTHDHRWTLQVAPLGARPITSTEWLSFRLRGRPGAREIHYTSNRRPPR